jgi:sulfate transport system permease protein
MPLRIEKLFQEYNLPGSFAVASLLTLVAIITLVVKTKLERKVSSLTAVTEPDRPERRHEHLDPKRFQELRQLRSS